MSILADADGHGAGRIVLVTVMLGVAAAVAVAAGALRRRSIAGPERLSASEPPGELWALTFAGFGTWLLVPALFVLAFGGTPGTTPTTGPVGGPVSSPVSSPVPGPVADPTTSPAPHPATAPASGIALSPAQTVAMQIVAAIAGASVMLVGGQLQRDRPLHWLGLTSRRLPAALLPALAGVMVAIPLTLGSSVLTQWVWELLGLDKPREHQFFSYLRQTPDALLQVLIVFSAVIVAPLFEELLFRGHLQTALGASLARRMAHDPPASSPVGPGPRWAAVGLAALLFALVHGVGWMLPPLMLLGICLGYAYERTGNLWVPIAMHAAFNAVSVALWLLSG